MEKLTMNVTELSKQLGISITKAYEVANREDFPRIKIGRRYVIPVEGFKDWIRKSSGMESK